MARRLLERRLFKPIAVAHSQASDADELDAAFGTPSAQSVLVEKLNRECGFDAWGRITVVVPAPPKRDALRFNCDRRVLPKKLPRSALVVRLFGQDMRKAPLCRAFSCAEEDSNLHPVIPDQALNLARLPIPPSARGRRRV